MSNKQLIIDTYWERVNHIKPGKVIKEEYIRQSSVKMGKPWPSLHQYYKARGGKLVKTCLGWAFKHNMNSVYGIHSYQLVYPIGYN